MGAHPKIQDMGLAAEHGDAATKAEVNDIEIRGYLISMNEGSEAGRIGLGLGARSSEQKSAVEGFQMTSHGLKKVGAGDTDAVENKTPGMAVGLLSMLAPIIRQGLL